MGIPAARVLLCAVARLAHGRLLVSSAAGHEPAEEAALRVPHGAGVAGLRRLLPAAAAAAPEEEAGEGDDAEGGDGDADDGALRKTAAAAALALLARDDLRDRVGQNGGLRHRESGRGMCPPALTWATWTRAESIAKCVFGSAVGYLDKIGANFDSTLG